MYNEILAKGNKNEVKLNYKQYAVWQDCRRRFNIRGKKQFKGSFLLIYTLMMILIVVKINKGIEIENPVVRWENNEIETVKSTFIHEDSLKSNKDYDIEINTVIDELISLPVKPGEELNILVKSYHKYFMVVERQSNGNYEQIAEVNNEYEEKCTIRAPEHPGEYVYSISVEYKAGLGIYYFSIEVVNN